MSCTSSELGCNLMPYAVPFTILVSLCRSPSCLFCEQPLFFMSTISPAKTYTRNRVPHLSSTSNHSEVSVKSSRPIAATATILLYLFSHTDVIRLSSFLQKEDIKTDQCTTVSKFVAFQFALGMSKDFVHIRTGWNEGWSISKEGRDFAENNEDAVEFVE